MTTLTCLWEWFDKDTYMEKTSKLEAKIAKGIRAMQHTNTEESKHKCIYLTTARPDHHWKWKAENGGRLAFIRNKCSEWNNQKNNKCSPRNNSKWEKFIHGGFHLALLHSRRLLHLHHGAGMETCPATNINWLTSSKFSIICSWVWYCVQNHVRCIMSTRLSSIKSFFQYNQEPSQILKYRRVS